MKTSSFSHALLAHIRKGFHVVFTRGDSFGRESSGDSRLSPLRLSLSSKWYDALWRDRRFWCVFLTLLLVFELVFYPVVYALGVCDGESRNSNVGGYEGAVVGFGAPGRVQASDIDLSGRWGVRDCVTLGSVDEGVSRLDGVPGGAVPGAALEFEGLRSCLQDGSKVGGALRLGREQPGGDAVSGEDRVEFDDLVDCQACRDDGCCGAYGGAVGVVQRSSPSLTWRDLELPSCKLRSGALAFGSVPQYFDASWYLRAGQLVGSRVSTLLARSSFYQKVQGTFFGALISFFLGFGAMSASATAAEEVSVLETRAGITEAIEADIGAKVGAEAASRLVGEGGIVSEGELAIAQVDTLQVMAESGEAMTWSNYVDNLCSRVVSRAAELSPGETFELGTKIEDVALSEQASSLWRHLSVSGTIPMEYASDYANVGYNFVAVWNEGHPERQIDLEYYEDVAKDFSKDSVVTDAAAKIKFLSDYSYISDELDVRLGSPFPLPEITAHMENYEKVPREQDDFLFAFSFVDNCGHNPWGHTGYENKNGDIVSWKDGLQFDGTAYYTLPGFSASDYQLHIVPYEYEVSSDSFVYAVEAFNSRDISDNAGDLVLYGNAVPFEAYSGLPVWEQSAVCDPNNRVVLQDRQQGFSDGHVEVYAQDELTPVLWINGAYLSRWSVDDGMGNLNVLDYIVEKTRGKIASVLDQGVSLVGNDAVADSSGAYASLGSADFSNYVNNTVDGGGNFHADGNGNHSDSGNADSDSSGSTASINGYADFNQVADVTPVKPSNPSEAPKANDDVYEPGKGGTTTSPPKKAGDVTGKSPSESRLKSGIGGKLDGLGYDVSGKFPFSVPFNVHKAVSKLVASSEAPHFTWVFALPTGTVEYEVDLAPFSPVATVLRVMLNVVLTFSVIGLLSKIAQVFGFFSREGG